METVELWQPWNAANGLYDGSICAWGAATLFLGFGLGVFRTLQEAETHNRGDFWRFPLTHSLDSAYNYNRHP